MSHLEALPCRLWGVQEWNEALPYAVLRICYFSPVCHDDIAKMATDNIDYLLRREVKNIRYGAILGNPDDMLELAARSIVGVTVPLDEDAACTLLVQLTNPANPHRASRATCVRAWALLSRIYFEGRIKHGKTGRVLDINSLYLAASCANSACALGIAFPGVIHIGMTVELNGLRRQEDCKRPGVDVSRFAVLTDLWRAVDRRKMGVQMDDAKREQKMWNDPTAYVCAAEGCGIQATHKAVMQRCAGKCAKEGKPAYCGKECQRKDWNRHRQFCREGAPVDEQVACMGQEIRSNLERLASTEPINFADTNTYGTRIEHCLGEIRSDGKSNPAPVQAASGKKERSLPVASLDGGQDTVIYSSTMESTMLKEIKAEIEKALAQR